MVGGAGGVSRSTVGGAGPGQVCMERTGNGNLGQTSVKAVKWVVLAGEKDVGNGGL